MLCCKTMKIDNTRLNFDSNKLPICIFDVMIIILIKIIEIHSYTTKHIRILFLNQPSF